MVNSTQGGSCHGQTDHWTDNQHHRVTCRVTPCEQQGVTKSIKTKHCNSVLRIFRPPVSPQKLEREEREREGTQRGEQKIDRNEEDKDRERNRQKERK